MFAVCLSHMYEGHTLVSEESMKTLRPFRVRSGHGHTLIQPQTQVIQTLLRSIRVAYVLR